MLRLLQVIVCIICFTTVLLGQGSYQPEGADYSFPRTIIDSSEIDQVRSALNSPEKIAIYQAILNTANAIIPPENSSDNDRAQRGYIAQECAFVFLMQRKIENGSLVSLTESDSLFYLDKTVSLLSDINVVVGFQEGWVFYWEWQLRSLNMMNYLIAYDLLKGAGIPSDQLQEAKSNLHNYAGNLYSRTLDEYPNPALPSIPLEFYSFNPNNHGILTSCALGTAAIVLNDVESNAAAYQPENWINAGMWNLDNTLWNEDGVFQKVSDGERLAGYAEGPNYFDYAFGTAMPFIRSMWNFLPNDTREYSYTDFDYNTLTAPTISRQIKNPWYDERYDQLYEWMNLIRMPDGRYPAIHDSGRSFRSMFTALSGNPRYNIPNPKSNYNSVRVRTQYLSTLVESDTFDQPLFQALPDAGSLIFRSDYNDPSGIYLHLIGKNGTSLIGAKAHHQGDATSFQLYFDNEDLCLDPGYSGAPYRSDVNKATDHNVILVNGKGPNPPNGEFIDQQNTAYIENFFDQQNFDYGEIRSRWQGTDIIRKTMFVDNTFFVIADILESNTENNYTFQLHGYGLEGGEPNSNNGSMDIDLENKQATYTRKNSNLLAHFSATQEMTLLSEKDSLSLGANGYQYYNKVLANTHNTQNNNFSTILFPYNNDAPSIVDIPLEGGNSDGQIISTSKANYLSFVQSTDDISYNISSLTQFQFESDVQASAELGLLKFDTNNIIQSIFLGRGKSLTIGNIEYINTDDISDVLVQYKQDGIISGYINRAGTLTLHSETALDISEGAISEITFDESNKSTTITFVNSGPFELSKNNSTSTNNIEAIGLKIDIYPNIITEQLSFEINNDRQSNLGRMSILDLLGRQLFTKRINVLPGTNSYDINIPTLSSGIYMVKFDFNGGIATKKIIVAN